VLRARLATAAVAIPLLLALIFWAPQWGFSLFVSAVAIFALAEYAGLAFPAQPRERGTVLALGLILIAAAAGGPGAEVFAALTLGLMLGLVAVVLGRPDFDRGLADLGLMMIGILYVGLLLPHFVWLRRIENGPAWITFVIAVSMAGDTGGYFAGRAFGRHRLIPRISPGKTVEGATGILAASLIAGGVCKLVLLRARSWTEMLCLALVMGVLGQMGDLSESVMKRSFGAKESGWIFPGHGGVLDRIDSLLFPVSFVYYYLIIFD
jgi:phosphatidate cytidylyltransferase